MEILRTLGHDPKHPLLFHSATFAVLFTAFYAVHTLLARFGRARLAWLLAFSLFYYWRSNGAYVLALVALAAIDWALALRLAAEDRPARRKLLLALSIASNLGALGYFKYTNFLLGSAAALTGRAFAPLDIFLPLGISFHVFQSLSYLVDVYRRRYAPTRSLFEYTLFLCFFPQIVAGPIVRAPEFFGQIHPLREPTRADVASGLFRVLIGVIKKALIADYIALYADLIFAAPTTYSGPEVALGVYAYALQIYFDFSGYSDMALGLARVLGVTIPENFDAPYRAQSLTEFWRRWHISLSSWLREYLYVPLGGNRHSRARQALALMLTMLLGGLWHGASWTFVLWGGLHGLGLALEKAATRAPLVARLRARAGTAGAIASTLLTFHAVAALWVLFRATSFERAAQIYAGLARGWGDVPLGALLHERRVVVLAIAAGFAACAAPRALLPWLEARFRTLPPMAKAVALAAVAQAVLLAARADVQPFIYFQF